MKKLAAVLASFAAALLWLRLMYVRQRAQAARDQRFGDSLRDQISRQLAQLEDVVTMSRPARLLGILLLPIVSAFTIILTKWRITGRSFSDPRLSLPIVFMICWTILMVGGTLRGCAAWCSGRRCPQAPAGGAAEGARGERRRRARSVLVET
jgi:hypothetical protein